MHQQSIRQDDLKHLSSPMISTVGFYRLIVSQTEVVTQTSTQTAVYYFSFNLKIWET